MSSWPNSVMTFDAWDWARRCSSCAVSWTRSIGRRRPREALRGLAADDLMQWVVLVVRHRDADLDGPVVVVDVRRDFGFRIPAIPLGPRRAAIEIDDLAIGADGDLIVGAGFGRELDLD